LIWRKIAKKIIPYVHIFYGVLPARVTFLKEMYRIPEKKLGMLYMGADDELVRLANSESQIEDIRKKYLSNEQNFLVVTGGKFDFAKREVLNLLEAIKILNLANVKLVIFGSIIDELKEEIMSYVNIDTIQFLGWLNQNKIYNLLAASDLVIFPGGHSVLWEQALALGKPIIVKEWPETRHIDLGGNCIFLKENTLKEIMDHLSIIFDQNNKCHQDMLNNAKNPLKDEFLYSRIAKKSLN
jgi:glycosyltransferase involved in cell wall biosynthesis